MATVVSTNPWSGDAALPGKAHWTTRQGRALAGTDSLERCLGPDACPKSKTPKEDKMKQAA